MTPRRVSFLFIGALGAFLAHQFGYAIADVISSSTGGVDHDYLGIAASFVVSGGVAALAWVVLRRERLPIGSFSRPALALLTGLQVTLFTLQEVVESGVAGDPMGAFSRPAVLLGFCLQPIVAWLLLRSAAAGQHLVEFIESAGAIRWQRSVGPVPSPAPMPVAGFGQTECPPPRLRGPPRQMPI